MSIEIAFSSNHKQQFIFVYKKYQFTDKATSHRLLEPDWPSILQICDQIRQNDIKPKLAVASIKKKLQAPNPHTVLYGLLVLESIVKNCGSGVHEEISSKSNCDFLYTLIRSVSDENVRQKILELVQAWNFAFRKNPQHSALKELMNSMKTDGYKFPQLRESDAMFSADTAPQWADGDVCYRCHVLFTVFLRKHHCRSCGQIFCDQCSQKTSTLPKFGIEKEVRVCDSCFDEATKPSAATKAAADKQTSELPPEYLKSPLAQQSQEPPNRGKSEQEIREEEEIQLALALSQSEAEAKERQTQKYHINDYPVEEKANSEESNAELARYLNRSYWESLQLNENANDRPTSPSAPNETKIKQGNKENGVSSGPALQNNLVAENTDLEEFIKTLKSQVEIFINRMKSNSSRGRSIANDTSVQTLFMNITAMHSTLFRHIQEHDDSRLHFERLQDKLTQVKDAREALDALREEHREKLRREAEEAERQRQLQMAHKLEIMRKKKQEYLQYQRQLALQRIQEQEREMQMRQEQQKHQYLAGATPPTFIGSPVHGQQFPAAGQPVGYPYGYMMAPPPQMQHPIPPPNMQFQPPPPPQAQQQQPPPQQYQMMGGMPPQGMHSAPPPIQYPPIPQTLPQPNPQVNSQKTETETAELISFD